MHFSLKRLQIKCTISFYIPVQPTSYNGTIYFLFSFWLWDLFTSFPGSFLSLEKLICRWDEDAEQWGRDTSTHVLHHPWHSYGDPWQRQGDDMLQIHLPESMSKHSILYQMYPLVPHLRQGRLNWRSCCPKQGLLSKIWSLPKGVKTLWSMQLSSFLIKPTPKKPRLKQIFLIMLADRLADM